MILTEVYGPQIVPGTPSKHRPRHIPSNICPLPFFKFISSHQPTPKIKSCPFKYQRRSGGGLIFPQSVLRSPGSAIFSACLTSFLLSPCTPEVNIPLHSTLLWGLFFLQKQFITVASTWVSFPKTPWYHPWCQGTNAKQQKSEHAKVK